MTGIPDELVEKAARAMWEDVNRRQGIAPEDHLDYADIVGWLQEPMLSKARAALEAVGLPALLERVEAAEADKDLFLFERDRARGQRDDLFEEAMTVRSQRDALAAKVVLIVDRMSKRNIDHVHPEEIGSAFPRAYYYAGDVATDIYELREAIGLPLTEGTWQ